MIGLGNCLESWLSLGGQSPRAIKALKEQSLLPRVVQVQVVVQMGNAVEGPPGGAGVGETDTHNTLSGRLQCRAGVCTTAEWP